MADFDGETNSEKRKQEMRQNCLAMALQHHGQLPAMMGAPTSDEVIGTARKFYDFTFTVIDAPAGAAGAADEPSGLVVPGDETGGGDGGG